MLNMRVIQSSLVENKSVITNELVRQELNPTTFKRLDVAIDIRGVQFCKNQEITRVISVGKKGVDLV